MGEGATGLWTRPPDRKSSKLLNGSDEGPTPGLATREAFWKLANGMPGELVATGLITRDCIPNDPH